MALLHLQVVHYFFLSVLGDLFTKLTYTFDVSYEIAGGVVV